MSERKIRKLTEMIEEAKKEVLELEGRLERAKKRCDEGEITKADFSKARMELSNRIRGQRSRIVRLEKARLNLERKMREEAEEKEAEARKREELRAERRREREKERRRRLRLMEAGEIEKGTEKKIEGEAGGEVTEEGEEA
ncbi:MAG: hypothetical protein QXW06_03385, partial [Thermoplasmata archaeon]